MLNVPMFSGILNSFRAVIRATANKNTTTIKYLPSVKCNLLSGSGISIQECAKKGQWTLANQATHGSCQSVLIRGVASLRASVQGSRLLEGVHCSDEEF